MTSPWSAIPGYTPQRWHPATALYAPIYRWKKPRVILVGDIFSDGWLGERRGRVFAVMALCPQHLFVLMTNHPDTAREYLFNEAQCLADWQWATNTLTIGGSAIAPAFPLPNLWLGTHVETQAEADERIPELLATPAALRFVHVTPREGIRLDNHRVYRECGKSPHFLFSHDPYCPNPISIWDNTQCPLHWWPSAGCDGTLRHQIDWLIVEGGPYPMHPDWVRSLRDQCAAGSVPFRFAGWGNWADFTNAKRPPEGAGDDLIICPSGEVIGAGHWKYGGLVDPDWREKQGAWFTHVGASRSGRVLDGVEHDATPEVGGGKQ